LFYTNVHANYNEILERGRDIHGKAAFNRRAYKPSLFIKSREESEYKTIFGEHVKPIEFADIQEHRNFIKEYSEVRGFDIYNNIDVKYKFIADMYPDEIKYNLDHIEIVKIDIETDCEQGFPNILTADQKVNVVTLHSSTRDLYYVITIDTYGEWKQEHIPQEIKSKIVHIPCENELELLHAFIKTFVELAPDITSGWNTDLFDFPYLINRITRVINFDEAKKLSPWGLVQENQVTIMNRTNVTYNIVGISNLDYLSLYKKFRMITRESYKLDYITSVELGEKKLSYEEHGSLHMFYKNDYSRFVDYNVVDVYLINKLDAKLKMLELAVTMAYKAKTNYMDTYSPVKLWDVIIYNYLKQQNIVIPPSVFGKKDGQIAGAYVKDPIPNMYEWITSFDVTSLYPHLIMQYNISVETLLEEGDRPDLDQLYDSIDNNVVEHWHGKDYCKSGSGAVYSTKTKGILPVMMELFFNQRKDYKKKMLVANGILEQIKLEKHKRGIA
jgi:DNA polymerase elongation subunit (family B)